MRARAVTVSLVLAGSVALVGAAQAAVVDALVARSVSTLLGLSGWLSVAVAPVAEHVPAAASPAVASAAPAAKGSPKARPRHAGAPTKAPAAVFVSAASVLALAQSKAEPRGTFVAESASHPAGLRLSGVGALGIGAEDGDILIEALGIAPRSSGQIIGAVIEARARRARYLTGTLWRRGQTVRLTVEQPYLDPA